VQNPSGETMPEPSARGVTFPVRRARFAGSILIATKYLLFRGQDTSGETGRSRVRSCSL
jgi:hypothetical protein